MARPRVLDFSIIADDEQLTEDDVEIVLPPAFNNGNEKKMNDKQLRARARRAAAKAENKMGEALEVMYKPLEDWDDEELARGRPKAIDGTFKGRTPDWIPRAIHEQAVDKFKEIVKGTMASHTILALKTLEAVLEDDETDDRGKPVIPASVKLEAAKFTIEHLLGKPKQEVTGEISVKLQAILASSMVPDAAALSTPVDVDSWEDEDPDDDAT